MEGNIVIEGIAIVMVYHDIIYYDYVMGLRYVCITPMRQYHDGMQYRD